MSDFDNEEELCSGCDNAMEDCECDNETECSEFNCKINLGTSALQTTEDLSNLLRKLADRIDNDGLLVNDYGRLVDINGNNVGKWNIE